MATTGTTFQFVVTNVNLYTPVIGGDQYAQVTFSKQSDQNTPQPNPGGTNSLTLTVPVADAGDYGVGKVFDLTLKAAS